ncbi:hypothetical protein CMI42_00875 [Candidatus Pacearchaeota archaeon]|jgi:hypothetical protein|nr:hypothetical protein [Candidatus Pacearchaeota archaeon]|tara:strand:+ start:671 stop:916 length:246 start_codon:yes stop_codon:yes gene_type:complete
MLDDEFKKKNFMERLSFVKYWARYVKNHDDKLWSKGQKKLIDGQFDMAKRFYEGDSEKESKRLIRIMKEFQINKRSMRKSS